MPKVQSLVFFILFALLQDRNSNETRALIEKLRSEDGVVREEAVRQLKALGAIAAEELRKAVQEKDPEVSARARHLLRVLEIRMKLTVNILETLPGIDERLTTGGEHTWTEVFLEASGNRENGERRYPGLLSKDFKVLVGAGVRGALSLEEKSGICKNAASLGLSGASSELKVLLHDKDPYVRSDAVKMFRDLGAKEVIPELVQVLKNDVILRGEAAEALGQLGAREAVPLLLDLLKDKVADVRKRSARALGEIGAAETIPALVPLLRDEAQQVRFPAALAIVDLRGFEVAPVLQKLLKDPDAHVRGIAAWASGELGSRATMPELELLLIEKDAWLRGSAAEAIGKLGATEALPLLHGLLKDQDAGVRGHAAWALGQLGSRDAAPVLRELLKDPEDPQVSSSAAERLCRMGMTEGVPALLSGDPDPLLGRRYFNLNAVRRPEVWKKLQESRLPVRFLEGSAKVLFEEIAKRAGLGLEIAIKHRTTLEQKYRRLVLRAGRESILDVLESLEWLESLEQPPIALVLEGDRIRVMSQIDAQDFWKAWWASEQEKKK